VLHSCLFVWILWRLLLHRRRSLSSGLDELRLRECVLEDLRALAVGRRRIGV
jgi:hypothetical protein